MHAYPELLRGTLERFFEDLAESEDDLRLVRAVVRIPDTEVAVPFRF